MEPQVAFENLMRLLADATFIPFAVGFVVVVTQVIRRLLPQYTEGREALLALAVQVSVWVVYSIFKARGQGEQFQDWVKAVETIMVALGSVLFPALLSNSASTQFYRALKDKRVPGFRSDE